MSLTGVAEEKGSKADDFIWEHLKGHSPLLNKTILPAIKQEKWVHLFGVVHNLCLGFSLALVVMKL